MKPEVTLEVIYPYSPERVWRALTDGRVLAKWLLPNNFEPRLGHRFQFHPPPHRAAEQRIECEVIDLQPPFRLAYTWQAPAERAPSVVTWTLEPVPGGTRLRLTHTRAEEAAAGAHAEEAAGDAWASRLAALRRVMGQPIWSAGAGVTRPRAPKRVGGKFDCRSERTSGPAAGNCGRVRCRHRSASRRMKGCTHSWTRAARHRHCRADAGR
jgi:uncharacterized protein YndB with AHSA1/START domain